MVINENFHGDDNRREVEQGEVLAEFFDLGERGREEDGQAPGEFLLGGFLRKGTSSPSAPAILSQG